MADTLDAFGWLADRHGCGHLRVELPLLTLRREGLHVGYSEYLDTDTIPKVRTLLGQRVCLPDPTATWQHLARSADRPRLVFEIDDDLFNVDHTSPDAHAFFKQPDIRANLAANLAVADAVTVTTERLADAVRQHTTAPVHIISNYLPVALLGHTPPRRDDRITIGWGGSPTHQMDFAELCQPLRRYLQRAPKHVEFHAIGTDYAQWMRLPPERCRFTPWIPTPGDFWRTIDFHIAVMPLRPHPFNQAKSWIKALEAAALGIPAIASDVGPYRDFIRHGETGYLVKRDHEWAHYLRALVEDSDMRAEMGAAAKHLAAQHTIENNIDQWKQALLP